MKPFTTPSERSSEHGAETPIETQTETPAEHRPSANVVRRLARSLAARALGTTKTGRMLLDTRRTQVPVRPETWLRHQVVPALRRVYWPVHPTSLIQNPSSIVIGVETSPGLMPGCYLQGIGGIVIGDYTQIGPHVGIHTNNHDVYENRVDRHAPVKIGAYCWLGMGAQVVAGVVLGDFTIVGAGAVVTKSFPDGHCVLAGAPARVIRTLDPQRCVRYQSERRYHGFIPHEEFDRFRRENLTF